MCKPRAEVCEDDRSRKLRVSGDFLGDSNAALPVICWASVAMKKEMLQKPRKPVYGGGRSQRQDACSSSDGVTASSHCPAQPPSQQPPRRQKATLRGRVYGKIELFPKNTVTSQRFSVAALDFDSKRHRVLYHNKS